MVDRYIDNIARTFHVPRSRLHVVSLCIRLPLSAANNLETASAKGLVAGAFTVTQGNGETWTGCDIHVSRDCQVFMNITNGQGHLIGPLGKHDTIDLTKVKWVLVVEKEVGKPRTCSNVLRSIGYVSHNPGIPAVHLGVFGGYSPHGQ